jgi:hypothetical protein
MSTEGSGPRVLGPSEEELFAQLCQMWEERDPAPADLADRISFALSLDDLEVELLAMEQSELVSAGHRGEEQVRTMTFSSDSLSVMVSISPGREQGMRIDGWITDGGGLDVELRRRGSLRRERADADGRFAFDGITAGLVQLVFHPTEGAHRVLARVVVTPSVQV